MLYRQSTNIIEQFKKSIKCLIDKRETNTILLHSSLSRHPLHVPLQLFDSAFNLQPPTLNRSNILAASLSYANGVPFFFVHFLTFNFALQRPCLLSFLNFDKHSLNHKQTMESSPSNSNSPFKAAIPSLPAPVNTQLQAPPSPRTHRALRRLQSAHTLGARAREQAATPSLISQQRQRDTQRNASPTRSSPVPVPAPVPAPGASSPTVPPQSINRSPQRERTRGRANSDATPPLVHQMNVVTASKRAGSKKPVFSHGHLPLHQIIREGPTDGDFLGALESARWKVIDEGVKSAEDGMVRSGQSQVYSQPY